MARSNSPRKSGTPQKRTSRAAAGAQPAARALREQLATAEQKLAESVELYQSLAFDRFRYAGWMTDFDRGGYPAFGGYGGHYGYPADRRQDRTHAPLPYLTEPDYFAHVTLSRDLLTRNPFGVGFLRHVRAFLLGNGVKVSFVMRGQAPGPSASGPVDADGGGQSDVAPAVKWASACWEEWCEVNDWGEGSQDRQAECAERWLCDGESNLRHFPGAWGKVPKARHVEPEFVRTPRGASLADPEGWGVETAPGDAESERALHLSFEADGLDPERVPAELYSRIKWGVVRSVKRGVSIMLPSAEHLHKVEALFSNLGHVAEVQAKIAWIEKYGAAATADQVRAVIEGGRDYQGLKLTPFAGASNVDVNSYLPGSKLHVENGREFIPGPTANPGGHLEIAKAVLGGVAFSLGLPESFTPGGGGDSFASALVTGSPFVRVVEEMQRRFSGFVRDVVRRVLALCEESGRIPAGVASAVKPVITCSPVVIADEEKQARTFLDMLREGCADPYQGMQELGYEPKTALANLADWKRKLAEMGAPPQQPPGGGGGNPFDGGGGGNPPGPNPAPPGSAGGDGTSGADWLFGEGVLKESGFTGTIKDTLGRERHYVDGKQVAGPGEHGNAGGGVARVRVVGDGGAVRSAWDSFAESLNGLQLESAGALVGAPGGAEVAVSVGRSFDGKPVVKLSLSHPAVETCERVLHMEDDGFVTVENVEFNLKPEYRNTGLGAEFFARQVEGCAEAGAGSVICYAARSEKQNGYYTWPRLGYDCSLTDPQHEEDPEESAAFAAARREFPAAKDLSDIMATPEGREWWKKNGTGFAATFDLLSENSRSMRVLKTYLGEKEAPRPASKESTSRRNRTPHSTPRGKNSRAGQLAEGAPPQQPPGGGGGNPFDGGGGGNPPGPNPAPPGSAGGDGSSGTDWLFGESIAEAFTGTVRDSLGREVHFVDGKRVAAGDSGGEAKARAAGAGGFGRTAAGPESIPGRLAQAALARHSQALAKLKAGEIDAAEARRRVSAATDAAVSAMHSQLKLRVAALRQDAAELYGADALEGPEWRQLEQTAALWRDSIHDDMQNLHDEALAALDAFGKAGEFPAGARARAGEWADAIHKGGRDMLAALVKGFQKFQAAHAGRAESRAAPGAAISEGAPGPPPRPGLVWNDSTKRWRNPETGGEEEHPKGGGRGAGARAVVKVGDFDPGVAGRLPAALAGLFGPGAEPGHVADALGAGPGDVVRISQAGTGGGGEFYVTATLKTGDGISASRVLNYDPATGRRWVFNDTISAGGAGGRGRGTEVFARQVASAAALGFDEIRATGDRAAGKNGYYTLPRWGYDGPIPDAARAKLPPELSGAETVLDVMATPGGREWWKANGGAVDLTFDLSPESRSRRTLAAYLAERGRAESRTPPGGAIAEGAPGPAPRPGLVWNDTTKRWVRPKGKDGGGAKPAELTPRAAAEVEALAGNNDLAPGELPAAIAADPFRYGSRLASAHARTPAGPDREALAAYIRKNVPGAEPLHAEGETVPFDGATQEAAVGVSTGAPVRVLAAGWHIPGGTADDPRPAVLGKSKVEPA